MESENKHGAASLKAYLTGFVLALLLTVVPFALVWTKAMPPRPMLSVIAGLAVIQILVHFRYFLHLDFRATPREQLVILALAAVLIVIMAGGTLWIMFNLHYRMMPG